MKRHLEWLGHLARMSGQRPLKNLLFGWPCREDMPKMWAKKKMERHSKEGPACNVDTWPIMVQGIIH